MMSSTALPILQAHSAAATENDPFNIYNDSRSSKLEWLDKMIKTHQRYVEKWLETARTNGKYRRHKESLQVVFATGVAYHPGGQSYVFKNACNTEVSRRSGSICAERNVLNMFHSDPDIADSSIIAICVTGYKFEKEQFVSHLLPCYICQSWLHQEERDRRKDLAVEGIYSPIKVVTFEQDTVLIPGGAKYEIKELQPSGRWRRVTEMELLNGPSSAVPLCQVCPNVDDETVILSDDEGETMDAEPKVLAKQSYVPRDLLPNDNLKKVFQELQSYVTALRAKFSREGTTYLSLAHKRSMSPRVAIGVLVDKSGEVHFTKAVTQNEAFLPDGCRCPTKAVIDSIFPRLGFEKVETCLKLIAISDVHTPSRQTPTAPCMQCAGMLEKVTAAARESMEKHKEVVVMSVRFGARADEATIQFRELHPEGGYRLLRINEAAGRLGSLTRPAAVL